DVAGSADNQGNRPGLTDEGPEQVADRLTGHRPSPPLSLRPGCPEAGAMRIERAAFWTGSKLAGGCSKLAGGCSKLAGGCSKLAGGCSKLAGGCSKLAGGSSTRGRAVYRASNCSVVARARGATIRSALVLSVGEYLARYA